MQSFDKTELHSEENEGMKEAIYIVSGSSGKPDEHF